MKQRQSIHALLQTLLSILLLAPIITQAEGNQPNLPNQPNPARQAPKPPELDANGRLIIQPPSRPTPRTQKYPTDWQNYFQQHNAYKYKATLYIKGHGVADRTAGYTPFSERAYNEIESVLGRAPLWNTQTWSGAIREQQQKEGSIEIVGHLTTHGIQKKGDYNGYALFWTITNRDSDTTQQTAFDAIYPEIKKYNARANGINKQKLTPAQREKAWQNWEKQLYAAAPRKPTDEQRETWRKAVEYSQREAAIRANRSQYEQAKEDFWKHLGQTLDDTTDHAQRVYKAFEEGAPADYSYASKSVYYANAMWNATTVAAGAITQGTGIDNAVATGYDHYTSDGVKQSINEKVQQYQQWAAEHPEANEYVKFAAYSGSAYAGYKGAAAIDAAWAAKAAAKENAKAAAQAVSREVAAQSRIAQNQAARKAANNAINERAAANASKPTPYKTPAAPSANAPKPAVPSANAPKPTPKPVANNPGSPKPVTPVPMPYVPAVGNQLPVPAAAAVAARAVANEVAAQGRVAANQAVRAAQNAEISARQAGSVAARQVTKKASSITSIPDKVFEHIIDGVPRGKKYVDGGHSRQSINVRVDRIIKKYPNGVYEAEVSIYNKKAGKYIKKHVNDGPNGEKRNHTMFPDSWTPDRIKVEIDSAWQNRKLSTNYSNNGWEGISQSGVKIEGFFDSVTGQMKNAYPSLNQGGIP